MLFVDSLTSKSCGIVMLHCYQVQHFVLKKRAKEEKGQTVLCIYGADAVRASTICPGCGVFYQGPALGVCFVPTIYCFPSLFFQL